MKKTQNLEMKIPEGSDPINITDITDNFETLDTEIAKKANSSGGDISNTTIKTVDTVAADFPVPSAGESSKTFLGKVKKFIQDFNNFKTGILTLGRLVNNGQTTEPGFALDARYGKTLYDLYAQLNADLNKAVYSTDLMIDQSGAFLTYNRQTKNTPFEAGFTLASEGMALVRGSYGAWQTVVTFPVGDPRIFIHSTNNGVPTGWYVIESHSA